jgi:hypothetical protein
MGAASGSATILASVARSPAGSRAPERPKNALREPQTEANLPPPPKTVDMVQPPSGCAALTAIQPSLQAASTSKGAATGSVMPASASAAACFASSRIDPPYPLSNLGRNRWGGQARNPPRVGFVLIRLIKLLSSSSPHLGAVHFYIR